jgi:hypothetical protein
LEYFGLENYTASTIYCETLIADLYQKIHSSLVGKEYTNQSIHNLVHDFEELKRIYFEKVFLSLALLSLCFIMSILIFMFYLTLIQFDIFNLI